MEFYTNVKLFNELINNTVTSELEEYGYKKTKEYKWIKSDNDEFRKGITGYSVKGMSKTFVWGVSLNFCPTYFNGKLKWHKTEKSADIIDINFNLLDYENPKDVTISCFSYNNEKSLISETKKLIARVIIQSESFYRLIFGLKDLELLYLEKINRKYIRFGFENYPQTILSYAFLLKKIGKILEANKYYSMYKEMYKNEYTFSELDIIYESFV
jgi:hypothetical protein